jgi:hypothetical protein
MGDKAFFAANSAAIGKKNNAVDRPSSCCHSPQGVMQSILRSLLVAAPFACGAVPSQAQESAANLRVGVNSQAIFVSGDFPPPLDSVVVRMAERAGQLSSLHITHGRGTVVVPTNLIEGLVASTNVDLSWYAGADDKLHASIQIPCKGWSDKAPAAQACKKVFILIDGQLKRIISHTPTASGNTLTYTDLP